MPPRCNGGTLTVDGRPGPGTHDLASAVPRQGRPRWGHARLGRGDARTGLAEALTRRRTSLRLTLGAAGAGVAAGLRQDMTRTAQQRHTCKSTAVSRASARQPPCGEDRIGAAGHACWGSSGATAPTARTATPYSRPLPRSSRLSGWPFARSCPRERAILPRDEPQNLAAGRAAPTGVAVGKLFDRVVLLGLTLHTSMPGAVGGLHTLHNTPFSSSRRAGG
jgi:hypothetical protein